MSVIRPYGDTTGDGMVQLSFTLPMPHSKVADGAVDVVADYEVRQGAGIHEADSQRAGEEVGVGVGGRAVKGDGRRQQPPAFQRLAAVNSSGMRSS